MIQNLMLQIIQGDGFELEFTVKDTNGAYIDLTGYTALVTVGSTTKTISGASAAPLRATFTPAESAALSLGANTVDAVIQISPTSKLTVLNGRAVVVLRGAAGLYPQATISSEIITVNDPHWVVAMTPQGGAATITEANAFVATQQGEAGAPGQGVPTGGTTGQSLRKSSNENYDTEWDTLTKSDVGLGNVDNTSDANKPISTATQAALNAKLSDPGGNGVIVRTAAGSTINRSVVGTTNQIVVSNGNGVAGNPQIGLPASIELAGDSDTIGSTLWLKNLSGQTLIRVMNSGRLGFGIAEPLVDLHYFKPNTDALRMILGNFLATWSFGLDSEGNYSIYTNDAKRIEFFTAGVRRFFISENGDAIFYSKLTSQSATWRPATQSGAYTINSDLYDEVVIQKLEDVLCEITAVTGVPVQGQKLSIKVIQQTTGVDSQNTVRFNRSVFTVPLASDLSTPIATVTSTYWEISIIANPTDTRFISFNFTWDTVLSRWVHVSAPVGNLV